MSVYPLFLVLGSDGTIGAYDREDILKIHLAENFKAGAAARAVYALVPGALNVGYERTYEYDEWVEPISNFCGRHIRASLGETGPTSGFCPTCAGELAERKKAKCLNQRVT